MNSNAKTFDLQQALFERIAEISAISHHFQLEAAIFIPFFQLSSLAWNIL